MISSDEESDVDDGKWLPDLFLSNDDRNLIETGDWLTDRHITAAQTLERLPSCGWTPVDSLGGNRRVEYSDQGRCSDTE